jgi:hypothetical protein
MQLDEQLKPYPEWRQLLANIEPLLGSKTEFSYEELKELGGGLDVRTWRGRAQFYKFRREMLKQRQIWFENVSSFGYTILAASEHPRASLRRVKHARHKINLARALNEFVRLEEMTPEQRALQAQTAVLLYDLSQTFNRVSRQFATAASKLHLDINDNDIKKIAEAPSKEKVTVTS